MSDVENNHDQDTESMVDSVDTDLSNYRIPKRSQEEEEFEGEDIMSDGSLDLEPRASNCDPINAETPIIPYTPGQRFSLQQNVLSGLTSDSRSDILTAYDDYKLFHKPPVLDTLFVSQYISNWPETVPYPKEASKENFMKKYPGLLRELDLVKKHADIQEMMRMPMAIIDNIKHLNIKKEEREKMLQNAKDAIQLGADKCLKISKERRRNVFNSSKYLKCHDSLLFNNQLYDQDELLYNLFGATFISNFKEGVIKSQTFNQVLDRAYKDLQPAKKRCVSINALIPKSTTTQMSKVSRHTVSSCGIEHDIHMLLGKLNLPNPVLETKFHNLPQVKYTGGRIQQFYKNWQCITNDANVLEIVSGHKINFFEDPSIKRKPANIKSKQVSIVVRKCLNNKLIEKASEKGLASNIFLKPKPSGEYRIILNLSEINESVQYQHFKLQSLDDAIALTNHGDYMVKLDLRVAYDSILIHKESRKYLQFIVEGITYQFRGMPNGLSEAPRYFTKLLKPILAVLGRLGLKYVSYIDDMLIICASKHELILQVATVLKLFMYLGFIINDDKSIVVPTKRIEFLGFTIDSTQMMIFVPATKLIKIKQQCTIMITAKIVSRRQLASLIGMMVAASKAIILAPLHYRGLQRQIIDTSDQNWEVMVTINKESLKDLNWWVNHAQNYNGVSLINPIPYCTITTDASTKGWGGVCNIHKTQGMWNHAQKLHHINYLELLAIKLAIKDLLQQVENKCILIESDSWTALSYIKKKGGTKSMEMTILASEIWESAVAKNNILQVQHIPGVLNTEADSLSRSEDRSDWKLNQEIFKTLDLKRGPIHLDLFAKKWNSQTEKFYSWLPQPGASGTDALIQTWPEKGAYAFPPFGLIPKILAKLHKTKCRIIMITPKWETACWYGQLLKSSIEKPLLLPNNKNLLQDRDGSPNPLTLNKLRLVAWTLSGDVSKTKGFQEELLRSWSSQKDITPTRTMNTPSGDIYAGVINKIPIPLQRI